MQVTYLLLAANLVVFGLEAQLGDAFIEKFALWPPGHGFAIWQPVTCAFLHANGAHLFTNMFGLWMFGRDVERTLGASRFAQLYGVSLLTASFAQLLVGVLMQSDVPTLGASGALFGILGAFATLYPRRTIMLMLPPIALPARVFVAIYALIELYSGVAGTQQGVAHFAHLGGLAGGWLLLRYWMQNRD
jgi:membrane associated rhomboid family serine protease